jgi:hypothetical protein
MKQVAEPKRFEKRGSQMEEKLNQLTARLKSTFGDRLVSAILFGSAASGDWNQKASDLNVLCVLSQLSSRELLESEPIFRWWREQKNPPPLLMTANEVRSSTDCFPMEFRDMQNHRRILAGSDIIAEITVDRSFYRAEVEHELRSKLLRLRQKAAEVLSRPKNLIALLTDSVSTFCVVGRHALLLSGRDARWAKQDIVADFEKVLGIPFDAFKTVLNVRAAGKLSNGFDAVLLFEKYLKEIEALVTFVDRIDK